MKGRVKSMRHINIIIGNVVHTLHGG